MSETKSERIEQARKSLNSIYARAMALGQ
ncbi:MAG: hypothetical protein LBL41_00950 [Bifidobacteriaceae bacterium]|nr:hypothetical protein [Bifidobacteriaceae bacterium]